MEKMKLDFEKVYTSNNGATWTREEPHEELVKLIKNERIMPCKTLEVGCGEGRDAIYLASRGFDVTAIDISETAIEKARENAKKAGVNIQFKVLNLNNLNELNEKFDFIIEWAIMHCIPFEKRKNYVKQVSEVLNENGKYFSICFNIQSPIFGNVGERIREGTRAPGIKIYFTPQEEIEDLFKEYFNIKISKVIETVGKTGQHVWNYFLLTK